MATPLGTRTTSSTFRAAAAVAVLLITAGLVILTVAPDDRAAPGPDLTGQQAQADVVAEIEQHLADAGASSSASDRARTPALRPLARGVWALVTIPRLDLRVPVRAGTDAQALSAGLGHWQNGIEAGQRGNYVLAGHRVTETEPFAAFPSLRTGDRVEVRTSNALYIYVLDIPGTALRVDQHALWVTRDRPAGSTTGRVITLITCAETFHTDDRQVVFGHLVEVQDMRTG